MSRTPSPGDGGGGGAGGLVNANDVNFQVHGDGRHFKRMRFPPFDDEVPPLKILGL